MYGGLQPPPPFLPCLPLAGECREGRDLTLAPPATPTLGPSSPTQALKESGCQGVCVSLPESGPLFPHL